MQPGARSLDRLCMRRLLLVTFQAYIACRHNRLPHESAEQHRHPRDPQDVPKASDHANKGAPLRDHMRNGDKARPGPSTPEGFLPIDNHQGRQERDGHREGDDADQGGQVERRGRQKRLYAVHPEDD
jgi:hypothetical protein